MKQIIPVWFTIPTPLAQGRTLVCEVVTYDGRKARVTEELSPLDQQQAADFPCQLEQRIAFMARHMAQILQRQAHTRPSLNGRVW